MGEMSFKDLEDVKIKATYKIEVGNKTIEPGETIAFFDKIQIGGLDGLIKTVSARGGFDNRAHVIWETLKEEELTFTQGVFSVEQFALLLNAKLINESNSEPILLSMRETLETDEQGDVKCKYIPVQNIFVYNKATGAKMEYTQDEDILHFTSPFTDIIVDYDYNYMGGAKLVQIGRKLLEGFVSLEGYTRVKDDTTGQVVSGIIKIPKLKLMSNLSIRLGTNAIPIVAKFKGIGIPVGSRGTSYISEFYFLDDDVKSDL